MMRLLTFSVLVFSAATAFAQEAKPAIFIPPTGDGFEVYIAAAMSKKNVPATVVTTADAAALTLKAAQVEVQKESAKMKVAKCLFQSCENTEDSASTSVQLVDQQGVVVWSAAVEDEEGSRKSMAETIAKRLKKDYFGR